MTVIFVVATLIVLLTLDWVQNRHTQVRIEEAPKPLPVTGLFVAPSAASPHVAGFALPDALRYHPGHTWALRESSEFVRVGLDDFAARLIGSADKIELPKFGQWIRQGQKLCAFERDGNRAELLSPIEGVVTDVNLSVSRDPSLAIKDPYGDGWLLGVQAPDIKTNFKNLLGGSVARQWMEEAAARLRSRVPALAGEVAQDGGLAVKDLTREMPGESWKSLTVEFFQN